MFVLTRSASLPRHACRLAPRRSQGTSRLVVSRSAYCPLRAMSHCCNNAGVLCRNPVAMDKEQLIREIFRKTAIWDQRHKSHHNRYILAKYWEEVAANCGTTVEQVKKNWKVLRQQFKLHFDKLPDPKSGDPAPEETVHWPYFKSLMFLKDIFEKRPISGNTGHASEDEDSFEIDDIQSTNDHDVIPSPGPPSESTRVLPSSASTSDAPSPRPLDDVRKDLKQAYRKCMRSNNSIVKELLEIKKDKIKMRKEKMSGLDKNDEDVAFFTSLLPHVKKLSPVDKMMFRLNVQKMLLEKVYGVSKAETMHSAIPQRPLAPSQGPSEENTGNSYRNLTTINTSEINKDYQWL